MEEAANIPINKTNLRSALPGIVAVVLALAFALLVIISDQIWIPWMEKIFPIAAPNLWGLVSRGHMLLIGILAVAAWRSPRLFGFQIGKTFQ